MAQNDKMQKLMQELSGKLGISEKQIEDAAKKKNIKEMVKNLDSQQAQNLENILADPEKTKAVLSSPQAQALLKLLSGE